MTKVYFPQMVKIHRWLSCMYGYIQWNSGIITQIVAHGGLKSRVLTSEQRGDQGLVPWTIEIRG